MKLIGNCSLYKDDDYLHTMSRQSARLSARNALTYLMLAHPRTPLWPRIWDCKVFPYHWHLRIRSWISLLPQVKPFQTLNRKSWGNFSGQTNCHSEQPTQPVRVQQAEPQTPLMVSLPEDILSDIISRPRYIGKGRVNTIHVLLPSSKILQWLFTDILWTVLNALLLTLPIQLLQPSTPTNIVV